MTGAIEFLKHARELCNNTMDIGSCEKCKLHTNKPYSRCLIMSYFNTFYQLSDDDIAELVREVEKWHRERSKND